MDLMDLMEPERVSSGHDQVSKRTGAHETCIGISCELKRTFDAEMADYHILDQNN